jgi:hypothetical protein
VLSGRRNNDRLVEAFIRSAQTPFQTPNKSASALLFVF